MPDTPQDSDAHARDARLTHDEPLPFAADQKAEED